MWKVLCMVIDGSNVSLDALVPIFATILNGRTFFVVQLLRWSCGFDIARQKPHHVS